MRYAWWLFRVSSNLFRTLEALYNNLPAFQMRAGMGVEVDEI